MQDERPKSFVKLALRVRRRIETVIGQLTERFEIEKCRCRDRWHMTSRIARKLLAHNIGSYLNIIAGRPAIQFENLISEDLKNGKHIIVWLEDLSWTYHHASNLR